MENTTEMKLIEWVPNDPILEGCRLFSDEDRFKGSGMNFYKTQYPKEPFKRFYSVWGEVDETIEFFVEGIFLNGKEISEWDKAILDRIRVEEYSIGNFVVIKIRDGKIPAQSILLRNDLAAFPKSKYPTPAHRYFKYDIQVSVEKTPEGVEYVKVTHPSEKKVCVQFFTEDLVLCSDIIPESEAIVTVSKEGRLQAGVEGEIRDFDDKENRFPVGWLIDEKAEAEKNPIRHNPPCR